MRRATVAWQPLNSFFFLCLCLASHPFGMRSWEETRWNEQLEKRKKFGPSARRSEQGRVRPRNRNANKCHWARRGCCYLVWLRDTTVTGNGLTWSSFTLLSIFNWGSSGWTIPGEMKCFPLVELDGSTADDNQEWRSIQNWYRQYPPNTGNLLCQRVLKMCKRNFF